MYIIAVPSYVEKTHDVWLEAGPDLQFNGMHYIPLIFCQNIYEARVCIRGSEDRELFKRDVVDYSFYDYVPKSDYL